MLPLGTSFIRKVRGKAGALRVLSIYLIIEAICVHQSGKYGNNRGRDKETGSGTGPLKGLNVLTHQKLSCTSVSVNFNFLEAILLLIPNQMSVQTKAINSLRFNLRVGG